MVLASFKIQFKKGSFPFAARAFEQVMPERDEERKRFLSRSSFMFIGLSAGFRKEPKISLTLNKYKYILNSALGICFMGVPVSGTEEGI